MVSDVKREIELTTPNSRVEDGLGSIKPRFPSPLIKPTCACKTNLIDRIKKIPNLPLIGIFWATGVDNPHLLQMDSTEQSNAHLPSSRYSKIDHAEDE
ncbi:hypothetical protein DESC_500061 [Desulfosarcina cetonica]|nr:hypothetical protein DESC_500061 [Desulfosarcina cetonica]